MTPASSKQKRWIAVLGALLPIALVAGIGLGGHPDLLPGFVRHALVGSDDGRTVNRALSIVRRDYYRKLAPGELVDRSIGGLVASLRDPFSRYLSKRDYRDFQRSERGGDRFSGVGMNVGVDPRGLRVSRVIAHSPAQRQGILAGDLVVA
ncbi:MAG TPA: hypothetical protein VHE14_02495, partial [Solirubrobacteraceae bacterium]|nr:hypothetical protein [Solirubrobacteraceae bacterium]